MRHLRKRGIVTKQRLLRSGKAIGGIPFTRGPLQHLLRNRFYVGEVMFKDEILPGGQPAILDRELFDAVQAKLNAQVRSHKERRFTGEAILAGRLFDDSGHLVRSIAKGRLWLSEIVANPTISVEPPEMPASFAPILGF
jgi:site-specific DNA recombinase